jgi:hypothetical protein
MIDACVGVLRRHIRDRTPATRDPWLLEDLDELFARIGQRPLDAEREALRSSLHARVRALRAQSPRHGERQPVELAALLHQQALWHRHTIRGRRPRNRRPRLVRRLRTAMDALLDEANLRFPTRDDAPVLHRVAPSFARLSSRLLHVGEALDQARSTESIRTLSDRLLYEHRALKQEATLLLTHADQSEPAQAAIGRWMDRAFELEAQWLTLSFGIPADIPLPAWHGLQNLQRALRRGAPQP